MSLVSTGTFRQETTRKIQLYQEVVLVTQHENRRPHVVFLSFAFLVLL